MRIALSMILIIWKSARSMLQKLRPEKFAKDFLKTFGCFERKGITFVALLKSSWRFSSAGRATD
ncbi:MAG: hypothetical protein ACK4Q5_10670 [Saprospiraceae bacterium]